jgi:hypothetical protein
LGARLEFPGVGVIAPEGFSQDQIPGRQTRGQGAAEPQGNQQFRPTASHQAFPGPTGRRRPHPGQGHHSWPRLKLPGRQPQVPAGPGPDPTQKRPHLHRQCSHDENPAGLGTAPGVPARSRQGHQGLLGNDRRSWLDESGEYSSGWLEGFPTCLGPRQRRFFTRRWPFLWSTVRSSRMINPCLSEISE